MLDEGEGVEQGSLFLVEFEGQWDIFQVGGEKVFVNNSEFKGQFLEYFL